MQMRRVKPPAEKERAATPGATRMHEMVLDKKVGKTYFRYLAPSKYFVAMPSRTSGARKSCSIGAGSCNIFRFAIK
jgi:hypothetical protein